MYRRVTRAKKSRISLRISKLRTLTTENINLKHSYRYAHNSLHRLLIKMTIWSWQYGKEVTERNFKAVTHSARKRLVHNKLQGVLHSSLRMIVEIFRYVGGVAVNTCALLPASCLLQAAIIPILTTAQHSEHIHVDSFTDANRVLFVRFRLQRCEAAGVER